VIIGLSTRMLHVLHASKMRAKIITENF